MKIIPWVHVFQENLKAKKAESTMLDVCIIGHVTRDIIRIEGKEKILPGGTAYYSSIALKSLGLNVAVVTKVSYSDKYLLNDLKKINIPVFLKITPKTTIFENIYDGYLNHRLQKVTSIATPFRVEDIPDISPRIFHIGPLTKKDIPLEVLKLVAKRSIVSLDVQGFLRDVIKDSVKIKDWDEKYEALSNVDIIKANEMEARTLTGEKDMKKAAKKLSKLGPKEVIITLGSNGSLIYSKEKFYLIPPYPQGKVVDPTGCGDTYMAGYIYMRLKNYSSFVDFDRIGNFAAAVALLKLQRYGPFRGSSKEVRRFLKKEGEIESSNSCCRERE